MDDDDDVCMKKAKEALGIGGQADPTVVVLVAVGPGIFTRRLFVNAPEPDVYATIGLLEQVKIDLLATVPDNKPLREPEPTDDDFEPFVDDTPKAPN